MGLSEAEVDFRHTEATASQIITPSRSRSFCCTENAFRGSEMGHSEALIEALHEEASVIRTQNIASMRVNGICDNCPKKAELANTSWLHTGNIYSNDR